MNCISCNLEHKEKYCPNCGERSGVKKITLSSIVEDSFSSITNMDKGFLFNIRSLLLHPRKITIDYVSGKRKGIFNPISFLILSITIYIVVITFFKVPKELVEENNLAKSQLEKAGNDVGLFLRTYLKYFWILSIIPLGISLKLFFRKYNFIEHLAISSFIIGQATLIGILSYLVFRFPLILDPVVYLAILWLVYKIFRNNSDRIEAVLISTIALILFAIQLILIIGAIGVMKYFG